MPVRFHDLVNAFHGLGLNRSTPVIAHASLSSFGEVRGGAETLLGALLVSVGGLMVPTFTERTMVIPEVGPPDNAVEYGTGRDLNRLAEFFDPTMPADPLMGILSETLRRHPQARRSCHPLLSFAGVRVDQALSAQTVDDPLAPVAWLAGHDGWVLLLGVNHTVNTSIHYAEKLAGRHQFTRWALTFDGIRTCPGYPGCSDGFDAIAPYLEGIARVVRVGRADVTAIPLTDLIAMTRALLAEDPTALLCDNPECLRCGAVRASLN